MSSINRQVNGKGQTVFRLRFKIDGRIQRVSIGSELPKTVERKLLRLIDQLEAYAASGEPLPPQLRQAVDQLDLSLRARLAEKGLIPDAAPSTLTSYLDEYIQRKREVTDHTRFKLRNTAKLFVEFFGDVNLHEISPGDVEDYIEHRKAAGKATATIGAELKHGKQFFRYAVRKRLVDENPFEDFKVGSQIDRSRNRILDPGMLDSVINGLPTLEWRAFISIIRWTGCRQSEALVLRWADILWGEDRIRLPSPKTAKQGKPTRMVPLFPQLKPVLREWFEQSPDGSEFVISGLVSESNRVGRVGKNLRKPFQRFIELAGFDPWPKPFQNLRSTRENELERTHPSHVVQAWIGHDRATAEKHYLRVSDADFKKAVEWSDSGQQAHADACNDYGDLASALKKPLIQAAAESCRQLRRGQAPRKEPLSKQCAPNSGDMRLPNPLETQVPVFRDPNRGHRSVGTLFELWTNWLTAFEMSC